jgi:DNA polymerase III subunit epsilon
MRAEGSGVDAVTAFPPPALAGLDIESTSTDVEDARTAQICLALVVPGRPTDIRTSLIDPGVEMPAEATAAHGLTTERLQAEGGKPAEVLDVYLADTASAIRSGMPLVIMNAPYDLTVLDREARRHGLPTLGDRLGGPIAPVLDPMVLDKRLIKYRKRVGPDQGARCLKTLCQVYRVPWDDSLAHDAGYDTLQAARVVWRIGQWAGRPLDQLLAMEVGPFDPPKAMHRNDAHLFRSLAGLDLMDLHRKQVEWYAQQTEDYGRWLRTQANEARHLADHAEDDEQRAIALQEAAEHERRLDSLRPHWPIIPFTPEGATQ